MLIKPTTLIALFLAGVATAAAAKPIYPHQPVLAYGATGDTLAVAPVIRGCTQLELSAGIERNDCGTLPLPAVARVKAEAEEDGDGED